MIASRATLRASRAVRVNSPVVRRNVRFASTTTPTPPPNSGSHATIGALAGAGAATLIVLGFYQFSGIRPAVQTATQTKAYIDSSIGSLKSSFKAATPDSSSEVIQALHDTANKYARWLPGGKQYVDKAFEDLEIIRKNHGGEVDKIVREAYDELRTASNKGMSFETASDSWEILQKHLHSLSALAADAGSEILDNHPELKKQFGGSFDQLKQLADGAGPEAKKMVDDTWKEVSSIASSGFSMNTVDKIRKLVQEKQEQIKKLGAQAWDKGYEQVKPTLEKNPQVKKFVEENLDTLKSGNVGEAFKAVQSSISSGNTKDLESYVQQAKDKAQQMSSSSSSSMMSSLSGGSGGGLSSWLNMIPAGGAILPALSKYKEVAEKHGEEAEGLAKETMDEIKQLLEKKQKQLEDLYNKAQEDAKKK